MKNTGKNLIIAVLFCFYAGNSVYALENESVTVKSAMTYYPARSIEGQSGRMELRKTDISTACEFRLENKLPLKFSLQAGHVDIREGSLIDIPSHLEKYRFDIETTFPFPAIERNDLYLRLGITPSFYSDDWDFESSAFRIPFRTAAIYKYDETLTFIAGARLGFDLEKEVVPFLGAIYEPGQTWTFELIPPRPRILYRVSDKLKFYLEAEYFADEYEVSRQSRKGLVLRSKGLDCGLGLAVELSPDSAVTLSAGKALNHYLEYADGNGKISLDDGWYLRLGAFLRF